MRPQSAHRTRKNYTPSDFTDVEKKLIATLLQKKVGMEAIVKQLGKPRMGVRHLRELFDSEGGVDVFKRKYLDRGNEAGTQ